MTSSKKSKTAIEKSQKSLPTHARAHETDVVEKPKRQMKAHWRHFKSEEVESALRRTRGLISYAAELLGCDQQTVRNHIKRDEGCRRAVEESRERRLDVAEFKLDEAIEAREPWAIMMYLRTVGRDRGYVERVEQDVTARVMSYSDIAALAQDSEDSTLDEV